MKQRLVRSLRKSLWLPAFRLLNLHKSGFECPICAYRGPFRDVTPLTGRRKHARCPSCDSLERHRLQFLVVRSVLDELRPAALKMIHFAPEEFFRGYFSRRFGTYETADIEMKGVDHQVDLQCLPFPDGSYDFVFASHVLEHVQDDSKAIREIRRILRPGGVAILPVPLVAEQTIEYPRANPNEHFHVRAPGRDYFSRYEPHFSKVELFASDSLPARYQLFIYENRSGWPTKECPFLRPMPGERHPDIIPVCRV